MPRSCARVLLVDDDALFELAVCDLLDDVEVVVARSLAGARAHKLASFDTVLLDDQLPDGRGLELLDELDSQRVVIISAEPAADMAIAALRHGAAEFLTKPIDPAQLRRLVGDLARGSELSDHSRAMRELGRCLRRLATADWPVLLRGETGTGKTRAARWLHEHSPRRTGPFVSINCGALPDGLVEAELFGVERGAYTGASKTRPGLLEAADGGTVFLDEIGDLPPTCQVKLLDVLESKTARRVGGVERRTLDLRFVTATHVDLEQLVRSGQFRRDLLFRLDVLCAELPPLRERVDGLPALTDELLADMGESRELADGELDKLASYAWPGNIRELRNVLQRCSVLQRGARLEPSRLLPPRPDAGEDPASSEPGPRPGPSATLEEVALRHMLEVARASPTRKHAAAVLGIGESTLRRKLKQAEQLSQRRSG